MKPETFRDLIDLWPDRHALRTDIRLIGGVEEPSAALVRQWYLTDSIGARWLEPIVLAAKVRGFYTVTYKGLAEIFKRKKQKRLAEKRKGRAPVPKRKTRGR